VRDSGPARCVALHLFIEYIYFNSVRDSSLLRFGFFSFAFLLCLLPWADCSAITFQIFHSFENPPGGPWAGLVIAKDGNFYGVADIGGKEDNGTVFRISSNGMFTVMHNFRDSEGSGPEGRLAIGTNGFLYGTTYFGGPNDSGSVFKMSTNGDFTTLAYFAGNQWR